MKLKNLLILTFIVMLSIEAKSQVTFSVSPGLGMNSANVGYKIGKMVPFVGFQMLVTSFSSERIYTYTDFEGETITDIDKYEADLNVYLPNIGLKYFILQKKNINSFVTGLVSFPIISGSAKYNGDEDEYLNDYLENTTIFGLEAGFGVEYFFEESFSLGGEFGFRYISLGTELDYVDEEFNEREVVDVNFGFMPTYTRISLNFYF